jgi:hypothetical protein
MNLETLYLKTDIPTPFQIINTENELIIFENRNAPFSLYSKFYINAIKEVLNDENKEVIIDYLQSHHRDTMQVMIFKSISPCTGNFKKIKDLSIERIKLINQYYVQEFLQNIILTSYFEFMRKTFFNKKESIEQIIKIKSI